MNCTAVFPFDALPPPGVASLLPSRQQGKVSISEPQELLPESFLVPVDFGDGQMSFAEG